MVDGIPWTPTLLRHQAALRRLLQRVHEFRRAQRAACVRALTNRRDISHSVSPAARYSRQVSMDQRLFHISVAKPVSGSREPQCAAALDHRHDSALATSPARTGFNSAYRKATHKWELSSGQE